MTRKTYTKKLRAAMTCIYHHPSSNFPADYSLGKALKQLNPRGASENFGSYKAAWDSDAMRFVREFYMGEDFERQA